MLCPGPLLGLVRKVVAIATLCLRCARHCSAWAYSIRSPRRWKVWSPRSVRLWRRQRRSSRRMPCARMLSRLSLLTWQALLTLKQVATQLPQKLWPCPRWPPRPSSKPTWRLAGGTDDDAELR
eukprot:6694309-Pyramimonas_sp.AAC.1